MKRRFVLCTALGLLLVVCCFGVVNVVGRIAGSLALSFGQFFAGVVAAAMEPMIVVLDFEGNVSVGKLDAAYELTTEDFQCRRTAAEFADFVEEHEELTWTWSDIIADAPPPAEDECSFRIKATAPDGSVSNFVLRLRKEDDGKWRVDEIVFP
jgi:hypothetical protein